MATISETPASSSKIVNVVLESANDNSHDSTNSDSDSDSDVSSPSSGSESEEISQEYFDSLLEKARRKYSTAKALDSGDNVEEEEIILENNSNLLLPPLNPGKLPSSYFYDSDAPKAGPSRLRDPDVECAEKAALSTSAPAPPEGPPELTKSGKPLTKRQKKELKKVTSGPDWFDMPAPAEKDLPRLYREVEAMRLRNHLDPKRFFRRDEGEGKGIQGLPKYFAMGTVVATKTPFGGATSENLTRAERKRSLVEELVDDAEAKRYAKKKFQEAQRTKGAKGKNTLAAKKAARKPKW